MWIAVRSTENDSTRLYKKAISQLLFGVGGSNEFVPNFLSMTTQRSRFGQNSCAADEQACVFGSCEFNKHPVLKIFMINGLNFQTVQFTNF